jgi:imidazolonepropionase-like amidohydrolase
MLFLVGPLLGSLPAQSPGGGAEGAKPAAARLKGMRDALADIEKGLLKQKGFSQPDPAWFPEYLRLLKKEHGIDWETVAKSQEEPRDARAGLDGYNEVMLAEIEHRFGKGALDKLQERAKADYWFGAAARGAPQRRVKPTAEHLFFKCKLLINPATRDTLADAIIETNGGTILRAGKADAFSLPAGAKVIDFGDKYVIPGLVDTHGHLYTFMKGRVQKTDPRLPLFYLAAGVTTIGDPGSMDAAGDIALRNRIDAGEIPGPRYFLAGEYIEMPPNLSGWFDPIKTPEEARAKVHKWAAQGATAIKIYVNAHGDVMQAAIDEAHEHSMRVWAHVGAVTFQQAIDMGVDQLFHGASVMPDTRRPGISYTQWAEYSRETANLDLTHPKVQGLFRVAAQRKVVLTPTAVISECVEPGNYQKHYLEEQKRFYSPAGWEVMEKRIKGPPPKFYPVEVMAQELKKNKEFIRRAHDAGCLLSTGTDYTILTMLPGWSLWREMEIFAEAGLPPMEVLKAATWNGAYAVGRTDLLGSVEAGKFADFVVLDANPLEKITHVRRVHRVVKGGVIYDREQLLKDLVGKVD